jgi:hypothetical protein
MTDRKELKKWARLMNKKTYWYEPTFMLRKRMMKIFDKQCFDEYLELSKKDREKKC